MYTNYCSQLKWNLIIIDERQYQNENNRMYLQYVKVEKHNFNQFSMKWSDSYDILFVPRIIKESQIMKISIHFYFFSSLENFSNYLYDRFLNILFIWTFSTVNRIKSSIINRNISLCVTKQGETCFWQ